MTECALQGRHDVIAAQPESSQGLAVLFLQQRLHLLLCPCMTALQAARTVLSCVSPSTASDVANTKIFHRNVIECRRPNIG